MRTAFVLTGRYPDHEILGRLDEKDWPDVIGAGLDWREVDLPDRSTRRRLCPACGSDPGVACPDHGQRSGGADLDNRQAYAPY